MNALALDRARFGQAIKQIRKQKGLSQQDVVDRIDHYGDVSAYRRVENGQRLPARDVAIAILIYGLVLKDKSDIDSLLALAEYEALSASEVVDLKVETAVREVEPLPAGQSVPPSHQKTGLPIQPRMIALAILSLVIGSAASSPTEFGAPLGLTLSSMYAGLYVISLLLETAHQPAARRTQTITIIFCLMLAASSLALLLDARLARTGNLAALPAALSIFAAAAIAQAILARQTLPDHAVVKGNFQMHTAQSAHLKNTLYFLFAAVVFWVPPVHSVAALRREIRLGHTAFVRAAMGHWLLLGHGLFAFNYGWLIPLLLALVVASLVMRTQLLDNLRPHPSNNSYLLLFYLRAALYFTFSGICVFWYATAIGSLFD